MTKDQVEAIVRANKRYIDDMGHIFANKDISRQEIARNTLSSVMSLLRRRIRLDSSEETAHVYVLAALFRD